MSYLLLCLHKPTAHCVTAEQRITSNGKWTFFYLYCSNEYERVKTESDKTWTYYRYSLIVEYKSKPPLPAPLIVVGHLWQIIAYACRRCCQTADHSQSLLCTINITSLAILMAYHSESLRKWIFSQPYHLVLWLAHCRRLIRDILSTWPRFEPF